MHRSRIMKKCANGQNQTPQNLPAPISGAGLEASPNYGESRKSRLGHLTRLARKGRACCLACSYGVTKLMLKNVEVTALPRARACAYWSQNDAANRIGRRRPAFRPAKTRPSFQVFTGRCPLPYRFRGSLNCGSDVRFCKVLGFGLAQA